MKNYLKIVTLMSAILLSGCGNTPGSSSEKESSSSSSSSENTSSSQEPVSSEDSSSSSLSINFGEEISSYEGYQILTAVKAKQSQSGFIKLDDFSITKMSSSNDGQNNEVTNETHKYSKTNLYVYDSKSITDVDANNQNYETISNEEKWQYVQEAIYYKATYDVLEEVGTYQSTSQSATQKWNTDHLSESTQNYQTMVYNYSGMNIDNMISLALSDTYTSSGVKWTAISSKYYKDGTTGDLMATILLTSTSNGSEIQTKFLTYIIKDYKWAYVTLGNNIGEGQTINLDASLAVSFTYGEFTLNYPDLSNYN